VVSFGGERWRGLLFGQGLLLETTVDQRANHTEQEIRHPHHQIDAVVVGAGFAERVVVLRTGGGNRFLSGRTGVHRTRQGEQEDENQQSENPDIDTHSVLLFRRIVARLQGEG
jgi:hypothetical protein